MDRRFRTILKIIVIVIILSSMYAIFFPENIVPGGITTQDPFSDGIPFMLSTFSPIDPTRKWATVEQSYDWNITIDQDSGTGLPGGGAGNKDPYEDPSDTVVTSCVPGGSKNLPSLNKNGLSDTQISILSHALAIAQDLEPGFWGALNHSPNLYPELWDQSEYVSNPNYVGIDFANDPSAINDMFWCTWMVIKSLQKGITFPVIPGTIAMRNYIESGKNPNFGYSSDPSINEIEPGSIIFYETPEGGHVGIVYNVTTDGIWTIESNSCDTAFFIPTVCNGTICTLSDQARLPIIGIGLYKGL